MADGGLYEIDMRLRPSGSKGPVAVHLPAFEDYYRTEAETWELMALTRGRVVWATSDAFAARVGLAIETALRRPHDRAGLAAEALAMRRLMESEHEAAGPWDVKRAPGGLVDAEFAAQFLQLAHAADGGPLSPNTGGALAAFAGEASGLIEAWRLQQDLSQLLSLALEPGADPGGEPEAFRRILAKAGAARTFPALVKTLARRQAEARRAWLDQVSTVDGKSR